MKNHSIKASQDSKESPLLDTNAASAYLSIQPNTLSIWISTKRYAIRSIKVGRLRRFRKEDLDDFLKSREEYTGNDLNEGRF